MRKLAVVTGANRGLGLSLVNEFSEGGWSVIALTRSPQPDAGATPSDVVTVRHDVRSNDASELLEVLNGRPVDLLINNAAQGAPHGELGSIPAAGVLNAVDVNAAGPLRMVQFLLPNLLAAPDPIGINMTSRLGSLSAQASGTFADLNTSYAYKISKAAQNMLTIALAQDLQGRVRCWAVHPGKLATDMGQSDASKDPRTAAVELRKLVDSGDPTSPRFCSLGDRTSPGSNSRRMLIIRQATTADTAGLIRLRAAWVAEQTGEWTADPDFESDYRAWQENNARTMFVAELDGTLIGMLNLMVFERMPKPGRKSTCWVYLGNAFVAAGYRNRGVGGQLLEAALQFSQSLRAARLVLSPSAESRTFYSRYGFAPAEELLVKRFECGS